MNDREGWNDEAHGAARGTLEARGLSFRYPGRDSLTLDRIDLEVRAGELVLLTGSTGSGKSTLLKCLAGIIPHLSAGRLEGRVLVDGLDTRYHPPRALTRHLGMVLQSPDAQLCATRVEDEIAFGLENLRLPRPEIDERIGWALEQVGLSNRRLDEVRVLSGGQKQRLVIAAALAMGPRILLLDEPISQLDPRGARDILALLRHLRDAQRLTMVLIEHRLEEVAPLADRVVVMDNGRIVLDAPRERAWVSLEPFRRQGLVVPALPALFEALGRAERPLEVEDAAVLLAGATDAERRIDAAHVFGTDAERQIDAAHVFGTDAERQIDAAHVFGTDAERRIDARQASIDQAPRQEPAGPPLLEVRGLRYRYLRRGREILQGIDLTVRRGERLAILGANGSGKSTLLGCLAGVHKGYGGSIRIDTRPQRRAVREIGLMFQDPDLMLLTDTVAEELAFAPYHRGFGAAEVRTRVDESLRYLQLEPLADEPPLGLSRGQRLRVAVASVLSAHPRLLLLDEPTTGQDRTHIETLMAGLEQLDALEALLFCTHDVGVALRHATRVIVMATGRIIADGPPARVLSDAAVLEQGELVLPPARALAVRLDLAAFSLEELVGALSPRSPARPGDSGEGAP